VLVVLEAGATLREDEAILIESLENRRALIARNKFDLEFTKESLGGLPLPVVDTSAITGQGVAELRKQLLIMVSQPSGELESGMLTSLRHHEAVSEALGALERATHAITQKIPHEMLLLDLYGALRQLDSLTGETTADDILSQIFSSFCIGK
jgi:tRNA modification GTPase